MELNLRTDYEDIQDNLTPDDEIEYDDNFDYTNFQVVRGEYFSHLKEPSIYFADMQFTANSAAVKKLPEADYVQILISPNDKKILVRAAREDDKDSFLWVSYRNKDHKRHPKKVTCKIFYAKLYDSMGWNPENKYKFLGKLIKSREELFFVFDLKSPEIFQRETTEGEKPKRSRIPAYNGDWKDQFGLPFEEHEKSLQIATFEDFVIFSLNDRKKETGKAEKEAELPADHDAAEIASHSEAVPEIGGPDAFRTI